MPNLLRSLAVRRLGRCSSLPAIVFATIIAALYMLSSGLFAQQTPLHLNPAIEKLAHGQPMIGIQTCRCRIATHSPAWISTTRTSTWSMGR